MTVKRRGLLDQQQALGRHRRRLGRVHVTIDDLQALRELLDEGLADGATRTEFEFDGGSFEEPADLPKLSDAELRRIVVKSANVEVILSSTQAVAIGERHLSEAVYTRWARARQTKDRPGPRPSARYRAAAWPYLLAAVMAVVTPVRIVPDMGASGWFLGGGVTFLAVVSGTWSLQRLPESYAAVHALSNEDYRKHRTQASHAWRSSVIGSVAVLVTLVIGVLSFILKK
ncbi:hypothetical protein QRX50_28525 [Amycolatopsis carbonis]|uniref:Uncharacterized protein n=1 Tax=Amycolatopsis carbonis TaxID=715471 RepID=A0A9Y2I9G4_9PSEU|nr:hypothetical protein [Amycolatopsis sp. 2-15]WIX75454.1 hypothetical protein QRX50_28525 [Amycolatopsis sp. 2-15]